MRKRFSGFNRFKGGGAAHKKNRSAAEYRWWRCPKAVFKSLVTNHSSLLSNFNRIYGSGVFRRLLTPMVMSNNVPKRSLDFARDDDEESPHP